jgi:hypothetical protein
VCTPQSKDNMVFRYGRPSIRLVLKGVVWDTFCIQGMGCLMSIDTVPAGIGCSSSDDKESSSEDRTNRSGVDVVDIVTKF